MPPLLGGWEVSEGEKELVRAQVGKARLIRHCKNYPCTNKIEYCKFIHFLYVLLTLTRTESSFGPFSGAEPPITMAETTDLPILVPPMAT